MEAVHLMCVRAVCAVSRVARALKRRVLMSEIFLLLDARRGRTGDNPGGPRRVTSET